MIYLGLGANRGARRTQLAGACALLAEAGFDCKRISPVVESPAMLPSGADPSWLQPYLNCVVEGTTQLSPAKLLDAIKRIEVTMGRDLDAPHWSPRPMDIDILVWEGHECEAANLTIPHPLIAQRDFVVTPLLHLRPDLIIEGESIRAMSQQLRPIPLWMGIINTTPDSFSDGGAWDQQTALTSHLTELIDSGVQILDFGAESTRPNANSVSPDEEWERLQPVLSRAQKMCAKSSMPPLISVDTRHVNIARRALEKGINWINDVTGLQDPEMLALVRDTGVTAIAMHSLGVPVDPAQTLEPTRDTLVQIKEWLYQQMEYWAKHRLDLNQVIFDPGIGFGKTALQSLDLLRACQTLRAEGVRLLIGHSRKSFMNGFSTSVFSDRDLETIGVSIAVIEQGIDVIRVHDPVSHQRVYRAWAHI